MRVCVKSGTVCRGPGNSSNCSALPVERLCASCIRLYGYGRTGVLRISLIRWLAIYYPYTIALLEVIQTYAHGMCHATLEPLCTSEQKRLRSEP